MITITKRLEFDYGHRLLKHEGKCRNVHGHRGVALIEVTAPKLDDVGRVIDFSVIKEKVGGWIEKHLDHAFIAQVGDLLAGDIANGEYGDGSKVYFMPDPPTAESLARLLFVEASHLLSLRVVSVTFYETPTSFARAP